MYFTYSEFYFIVDSRSCMTFVILKLLFSSLTTVKNHVIICYKHVSERTYKNLVLSNHIRF